MLTELRRYAVQPGMMDAMHARMADMLLPLFAANTIPTPIAIWDNRDATSTLTWMLTWPSFDARQAGWARIAPLFVAARAAEGTPEFVTRTTLTLIAPWPGAAFGFDDQAACETAWHVQPRIGGGAGFVAACQAEAFDRFRAAGATRVDAANLVFGALPQAVVILGWPDAQRRAQGMAQIAAEEMDAALLDALPGEGRTFATRGDWETLDRADYLPR